MGFAVTETEYIIGRLSGNFIPPLFMPGLGKRPAFGPATKEEEKKGSKTILEKATEESFIEYWREVGRTNARNHFNAVPKFITASGYYYQQPAPDPFNLGGGLFGIQAYICNKCYAMKPRMLYFVPHEKGGSIQSPIYCNRDGTDLLTNTKMTGEQYIKYFSKDFPRYLKDCITNWTNNKTSLIAAEVSDPARDNDRITFVLSGTAGEKKSITLQYSEEKCLELNPKDTGNWALRAIKEKRTPINEQELEAFLHKTKDSTFGFFKIMGRGDIAAPLYLIAVVKDESPGSSSSRSDVTNNAPVAGPTTQDNEKSALLHKQQPPMTVPQPEQQLGSEPVPVTP